MRTRHWTKNELKQSQLHFNYKASLFHRNILWAVQFFFHFNQLYWTNPVVPRQRLNEHCLSNLNTSTPVVFWIVVWKMVKKNWNEKALKTIQKKKHEWMQHISKRPHEREGKKGTVIIYWFVTWESLAYKLSVEYKNNKLYKGAGGCKKNGTQTHQAKCKGKAIICTKHSRGSVQQPIGKKCEMNSWFGKHSYHQRLCYGGVRYTHIHSPKQGLIPTSQNDERVQ